ARTLDLCRRSGDLRGELTGVGEGVRTGLDVHAPPRTGQPIATELPRTVNRVARRPCRQLALRAAELSRKPKSSPGFRVNTRGLICAAGVCHAAIEVRRNAGSAARQNLLVRERFRGSGGVADAGPRIDGACCWSRTGSV